MMSKQWEYTIEIMQGLASVVDLVLEGKGEGLGQ
jgi:hypothetical protein